MQHSAGFRVVVMALAVATGLFAVALRAGAQPEPAPDTMLAPGNPPLTERIAEQYTDFQAWLLEIPVTREMRGRQRADLVTIWKDPQEAKAILGYLAATAPVAQYAPEDREFFRVSVQSEMLASMRVKKDDPTATFLAAAYDAAHPPIAAGSPPLTESMVSHYVAFLGWLLEIPVTQSFATAQRTRLVRGWSNPKEVQTTLLMLKWQLDTARLKDGTAHRDYARALAQPVLMKGLRAEKTDADSRLLVEAFDVAHRPIVDGDPPLTRQASDAWTELYCFVNNQAGYPHMDATPPLKQRFSTALAITYLGYTPEERRFYAGMPLRWAALRWTWMGGQDADRRKIMAAWLPLVHQEPSGNAQLAAAQKARVRLDAFLVKNPATVSRSEMLAAAADEDIVAAQYRRQNDQLSAADSEELSRTFHTGSPQAYVNLVAQWKANGDRLAIMRANNAAHTAMIGARFMSNVYVSGDAAMANVISNINNSPYQTIVVPVGPK
jgi:hypothetical protein